MSPLTIGGLPVVTLSAPAQVGRPSIVEATVLPGRGFMLLQARLALPSGEQIDLLYAPSLAEAAAQLDGGADDFAGSRSFSFGGALLVPYANRIRGRPADASREIETEAAGHTVRLPRNWGGKAQGAEQYAMHGLILDQPIPFQQPAPHLVEGEWAAGDFGGRWPGDTRLAVAWRLEAGSLQLRIEARNAGADPLPIGIGWHPYVRLPSGGRGQARLRIPAELRVEVDNYDQVLPTGRLLGVADTPFDFRRLRTLDDQYLDDCFTKLTGAEPFAAEIHDPAAGLGLRIAAGRPVSAFQVYAPTDQAFVVVEPQFNLADPFGPCWGPGADTGMVQLQPGASTVYETQVSPFAIGSGAMS